VEPTREAQGKARGGKIPARGENKEEGSEKREKQVTTRQSRRAEGIRKNPMRRKQLKQKTLQDISRGDCEERECGRVGARGKENQKTAEVTDYGQILKDTKKKTGDEARIHNWGLTQTRELEKRDGESLGGKSERTVERKKFGTERKNHSS